MDDDFQMRSNIFQFLFDNKMKYMKPGKSTKNKNYTPTAITFTVCYQTNCCILCSHGQNMYYIKFV